MIIHHPSPGQTNRRNGAVMKGSFKDGKIGALQVSFIDGMTADGTRMVNANILEQIIPPRDTFRHSTPLNPVRARGRR